MNVLYIILLIVIILVFTIGIILFFMTRENYNSPIPNFIIIGVQKGGTTNIQKLFKLHNDIFMYPKEIHHFNNRKMSNEKYVQLFKTNKKIVGEKTPDYFCRQKAMRNIYKFNPNMKLILFLRNPIKRAYSAWNHYKQDCPNDKRSFKQCINDEFKLIKKKYKCLTTMNINHMIMKGYYIDHIEYILSLFPRKQLYIVISEHFKNDTKNEFDKLLHFLGADTNYNFNINSEVHKRTYKKDISHDDYNFLYNLYKPYNERLYNFLGYRIEEWE